MFLAHQKAMLVRMDELTRTYGHSKHWYRNIPFNWGDLKMWKRAWSVLYLQKKSPESWWRPPIFPNSPQKHGWWWPPCSWRGSQHSSSPEDLELPHQLCSPPPQLTCSTWRSPAKDFRTGVQIFIHIFQDFWRFAHLSPHAAINNGLGEIFNNDDLWQICWQRAHEVPHAC